MTINNEQIQALKELCIKAGGEEWVAFVHSPSSTCSVHTPGDERCGDVIKWAGFDGQKNAKAKAKFIAAANPAAILSLLAERDADKALIAEQAKHIAELEARTLTVKLPRKHKNPRFITDGIYNKGVDDCYLALMEACAAAGITLVVGE